MGFSIFLDANVILDLVLKRDDYENTRKLFQQVLSGQFSAFTSPSIIHIIGYWLTKVYGTVETRQIMLTLLKDVHVVELNHDICIQALHSNIQDVEDALQYHTALYHKIDCFVSRDKKLKTFKSSILPVLTPEELLKAK
jgi:predicted nucleic acid-binding protein